MRVFISHSSQDKIIAMALAHELRQRGCDVGEVTFSWPPRNVASNISAAIRSADAVVAILTTESPNVFYELGLALGANKSVLLATSSTIGVPYDACAVPYVQLSGELSRDCFTIARRLGQLKISAHPPKWEAESAKAALRIAVRNPDYLESLTPVEFEELIAAYFREQGYHVERSRRLADSGVDLMITSPVKNTTSLIQIKKYSRQSLVSIEAVR